VNKVSPSIRASHQSGHRRVATTSRSVPPMPSKHLLATPGNPSPSYQLHSPNSDRNVLPSQDFEEPLLCSLLCSVRTPCPTCDKTTGKEVRSTPPRLSDLWLFVSWLPCSNVSSQQRGPRPTLLWYNWASITLLLRKRTFWDVRLRILLHQ
jgi:hypothetical protein